jgi:hypothetical protein
MPEPDGQEENLSLAKTMRMKDFRLSISYVSGNLSGNTTCDARVYPGICLLLSHYRIILPRMMITFQATDGHSPRREFLVWFTISGTFDLCLIIIADGARSVAHTTGPGFDLQDQVQADSAVP